MIARIYLKQPYPLLLRLTNKQNATHQTILQMNSSIRFFFPLFFLLLSISGLQATTISPFPNLGEMAKGSPAVVLAKAERNFTADINGTTRYRTTLKVVEHIKGTLAEDDHFVLQNYRATIGDLERIIWGDLELEEGKTYLLFLNPMDDGLWQTTMLSYAAFEQHIRNDEEVLVPFDMGTEVHFHLTANQPQPENLAVFKSKQLTGMLKEVVQSIGTWDRSKATTTYNPASFAAGSRSVPPGHCTFISNTANPARWENIETTALPVRFGVAGDPGCATEAAEIAAAIGSINTNYAGLTLANSGTHAYVPSCGGGEGATDSEFTTWVSTNLGTTRTHLIQFDDPCSEIADLVGCNGTLAFGGLYWFSSTHMYNGASWQTAAYGYVVVNNGTGACQCGGGTDYEIMMTHELTHSLNIGHISAGTGSANMNPSCCNSISALDIQCLDYIYATIVVPVELTSFTGLAKDKSIQLDWATASETNNDFFLLEKRNADGSYSTIAKVEGAGNSLKELGYNYIDQRPSIGTNYYRLSQNDFNGDQEVIKEIAVDYFSQLAIDISPNPLSGDVLQLQSVTDKKGDLTIEIFDLNGKTVYQSEDKIDIGKQQSDLDLSDLPSGLYIFKATQNNQVRTLRFVKN